VCDGAREGRLPSTMSLRRLPHGDLDNSIDFKLRLALALVMAENGTVPPLVAVPVIAPALPGHPAPLDAFDLQVHRCLLLEQKIMDQLAQTIAHAKRLKAPRAQAAPQVPEPEPSSMPEPCAPVKAVAAAEEEEEEEAAAAMVAHAADCSTAPGARKGGKSVADLLGPEFYSSLACESDE